MSGEVETDCEGEGVIRLRLPAVERPGWARLSVDLGRRRGERRSATTAILVMPAAVVPAFALPGPITPGEPATIELAAVGFDGSPVSGRPLSAEPIPDPLGPLAAADALPTENWRCEVVSAAGVVPCTLVVSRPGYYRGTVVATDAQGRRSQDRFSVGIGVNPPRVPPHAELVSAQAVDGELRILLDSPFAPASVLLAVGGLPARELVAGFHPMDGRRHELRAPLRPDWRAAEVHAMVLDQTGQRVAWGTDLVQLSPAAGRLELSVVGPRLPVTAGKAFDVEVRVRDKLRQPVPDAEVVLAVSQALQRDGLENPPIEFAGRATGRPRFAFDATSHAPVPGAFDQGMFHRSEQWRRDVARAIEFARGLRGEPEWQPPPSNAGLLRFAPESRPMEASRAGPPLVQFDAGLRTDATGTARARVILPYAGEQYGIGAVAVAGLRTSEPGGARLSTLPEADQHRRSSGDCDEPSETRPAAGGCASCGTSASIAASMVPLGLLMRRRRRAS